MLSIHDGLEWLTRDWRLRGKKQCDKNKTSWCLRLQKWSYWDHAPKSVHSLPIFVILCIVHHKPNWKLQTHLLFLKELRTCTAVSAHSWYWIESCQEVEKSQAREFPCVRRDLHYASNGIVHFQAPWGSFCLNIHHIHLWDNIDIHSDELTSSIPNRPSILL